MGLRFRKAYSAHRRRVRMFEAQGLGQVEAIQDHEGVADEVSATVDLEQVSEAVTATQDLND